MNDIIKIAKSNLELIYKKYKDKGISSIYLWGSATTEDFDPLTSDIDSIAIVDGSFDMNMESDIQKELQDIFGGTNRFGFRVLYTDELKNGVRLKSNLASYISPSFFIFDLPNWTHVEGIKYSQSDFTNNVPTISNVIKLRLEEIVNRGWQDASLIEPDKEQYYVKCLWRIVHLLQLSRGIKSPFSYKSVIKNSNADEKEIVDIIDEIKKSKYNRNIFLKHSLVLNTFTDSIISKYIPNTLQHGELL